VLNTAAQLETGIARRPTRIETTETTPKRAHSWLLLSCCLLKLAISFREIIG